MRISTHRPSRLLHVYINFCPGCKLAYCSFGLYMLSPILTSEPGRSTLPLVEATVVDLPLLDGPRFCDKSILSVTMLSLTVADTFLPKFVFM